LLKTAYRRNYSIKKQSTTGFTLVELLVVIAIVAILAAVVVLIINPLELTRRSRDAARLSDLANLQQAINVAAQEATTSGNDILCAQGLNAGICTEDTDPEQTNTRLANGTGWVKVNLGTQKSVSVPTLPVDPINNADYHYTYCSNGSAWEINTKLESEQQKPKMGTDGGPDAVHNETTGAVPNGVYETGSDLSLIAPSGACTY
jgi:prepilin-type N-terminal cleavage/methylation domain-containing protein